MIIASIDSVSDQIVEQLYLQTLCFASNKHLHKLTVTLQILTKSVISTLVGCWEKAQRYKGTMAQWLKGTKAQGRGEKGVREKGRVGEEVKRHNGSTAQWLKGATVYSGSKFYGLKAQQVVRELFVTIQAGFLSEAMFGNINGVWRLKGDGGNFFCAHIHFQKCT